MFGRAGQLIEIYGMLDVGEWLSITEVSRKKIRLSLRQGS